MKKNALLLVLIGLVTFSGMSQVTQTKMALVSKRTATWCNPCGTWGWAAQENIYLANNSKAVILQVHSSLSSGLNNSSATELQQNFPVCTYTPAWFVNGKNRTYRTSSGGIVTSQTIATIKSAVDSTAISPVLANCSYTKTINGYDLTVNTISKFFIDTTGEYYLSVLLVEDNVVAYQNGIGNNAIHTGVLRGSMSSSVFGEMIASGNISADTTISKVFSKTLDPNWSLSNMYLALVIWKKVGNEYIYVNAYKDEVSVGIKNSSAIIDDNFVIYPNPASDVITIKCSSSTVRETRVSIYNIQGKLFQKDIIRNDSYIININGLPKGIYFLKLENEDEAKTLRFEKM